MNDSFSIETMKDQTTPDHRRRTQLLVLIAIATQVGGNVSLSYGLHRAGAIISVSPLDYIRALNLWTIAGIIMLSVWIITDLALLSRADLSFVLPVIASSFVVIAIVGHSDWASACPAYAGSEFCSSPLACSLPKRRRTVLRVGKRNPYDSHRMEACGVDFDL
jgi:hypothetical protein